MVLREAALVIIIVAWLVIAYVAGAKNEAMGHGMYGPGYSQTK